MLMFQTLYPVIVVLLLALIALVHLACSKKDIPLLASGDLAFEEMGGKGFRSVAYRKIIFRYVSVGLAFISFILPITSTVIFSTFSCDNVDPNSVETGDDRFMTADYSMSCQSSRYHSAYYWAVAMIFVYPIGVPLIFFILLYSGKEDITYRRVSLRSDLKRKEREVRLDAIRGLYGAYKPEYWYWEVLETVFRLSLTGFLVLVNQGSASQIIVGMCIALAYSQIIFAVKPFDENELNTAKIISLWQIYLIFLFALLYHTGVISGNDWRNETFVFCVGFAIIPLELFLALFPRLRWYESRERKLTFRDSGEEGL